VTIADPLDITAWSGLNRHIALSLEQQGVEMDYIGRLRDPYAGPKKVRYRVSEALGRGRYLAEGSHLSSRSYARQALRRLNSECDVVFSTGTIPLAYLRTELPLAFWADATLPAMLGFYPSYSNMSSRSVRAAKALEKRALDRVSLAIYASTWAAEASMDYYGMEPEKVTVVPFGANLDGLPTSEEIARIAEERPLDRCQLLFLAVEWDRKGGDIAVEATRKLNARGIPTKLVVAGCTPPPEQIESFVECRGFIDKRDEAGRAQLRRLLAESHFLIHPARAEAYGIAMTEASAFGLPVVAAGVGGITTIVRPGRNGYTFPAEADGGDYATAVQEIFEDREHMLALAQTSRDEYDVRLNWEVAAAAVADRLGGLVG
jgi:glycosyltransferase involved in cell wall biosynthesis